MAVGKARRREKIPAGEKKQKALKKIFRKSKQKPRRPTGRCLFWKLQIGPQEQVTSSWSIYGADTKLSPIRTAQGDNND